MPVRIIKSVPIRKGIVYKRPKMVNAVGSMGVRKTFPDGITQPVLNECCKNDAECKKAFDSLNDPLTEEDKTKYNSWLSKNVEAILSCNKRN